MEGIISGSVWLINPESSSCRASGCALAMEGGGLGVGLQSGFAIGLIWVSQMLGENETSLQPYDLVAPAPSLFSQPVTTLGFRQSPNQEVLPYTPPLPPTPTYTHASRNCTHLHWGKGNTVMTTLNWDAKGYHYKWLHLTFNCSTTHTHVSDPELLCAYTQEDHTSYVMGSFIYNVGSDSRPFSFPSNFSAINNQIGKTKIYHLYNDMSA